MMGQGWRRLASVVIAAAAFGAIGLGGPSAHADQNVVPDAEFQSCLNTVLGQSADAAITVEQLNTIGGVVNCSARDVKSVEGAEFLINVAWLSLSGGQIGDTTPIAKLASSTNLVKLYLGGNRISNIAPLAAFGHSTSLVDLDLGQNQISDITALASLASAKALTTLRLNYNQIADVSPLSGLTSLDDLELSHNQISDVTPLGGLTNLSVLFVSNNRISDVKPLSRLVHLRSLGIYSNQISDVSSLASLPACPSGILALGQTVTLPPMAVPGTFASPVVSTPGEPIEMIAEPGPVSINQDGTITVTRAGTVKLDWDTTDFESRGHYFSGTLIVTIGETPSATPAPDTPSVPPSPPPTEVGSSHGVLTMVIIGLAVVVVGAVFLLVRRSSKKK